MLLIWSGLGFLVIPVVIGTSVVVGALCQLALDLAGFPQFAFLAFSLGLFAAAWANWTLGKRLNGRPGRELIDAQTGERVVLRRTHRLFWIRMEHWSIPVAVMALVPLLAIPSVLKASF